MSTSTIKEFLVRLGYKVDSTGERKFVDGVNNATKVVNGLGTALKVLAAGGAAAGALAWFGKMANSLEGLYYSSQRAGASAKNLQAFSFAAAQMGSSVEEAQSAVQGFHQWMLNSPGSEMWLRRLGIGTRGANGQLRDATDMLQDLGKKLAQMPSYQANQYAQLLGIPLKLRLALQQGMGGYIADYRKMLAEAGLDSDQAAKRSHQFLVQVRNLGGAFHILGLKIASALMGKNGGGGALDRFRHLLLSHSDQISRIAGKIGDFLSNSFEKFLNWLDNLDWDKVSQGIKGVVDWFQSIDWGKLAADLKKLANSIDEIVNGMGGWKNITLGLGAVLALSLLSPILSIVGALGRLVPLLGTGGAAGSMRALGAAISAVDIGALASILGLAGLFYSRSLGGRQRLDGSYEDEVARPGAAPGTDMASLWAKVHGQKSGYRGSRDQAAMALALRLYADHMPDDVYRQAAADILSGKITASDFPGGAPLGIRNNNPGNLRTGPGGAFGTYGSAQQGLNALGRQLRSYYNGTSAAAGHKRLRTLRDIIGTYAPSSENNTGAYIADLAKQLGVGADTPLNLNDPAQLSSLMRGIVRHENGMNPYSAEMFKAAAASVTQAGKGASVHAETKIYVQGASDPNSTAQAVAGKQNSVNQRLFRDFGAAVA